MCVSGGGACAILDWMRVGGLSLVVLLVFMLKLESFQNCSTSFIKAGIYVYSLASNTLTSFLSAFDIFDDIDMLQCHCVAADVDSDENCGQVLPTAF